MEKSIIPAIGIMMCGVSSCDPRIDIDDNDKGIGEPAVEVSSPSEERAVIHYSPEFLEELRGINSSVTDDLPEIKPGKLEITLSAWEAGDFQVSLDLSQQVFRLSIPTDHDSRYPNKLDEGTLLQRAEFADNGREFSPQLDATLAVSGNFLSASELAFKAKQFDDGLMAAVEYAIDQGSGAMGSRRDFLSELAKALNQSIGGEGVDQALGLLVAASKLGGQDLEAPPHVMPIVRRLENEFLGDPNRSKPIGIYTWSQDLANIYRRDRMLQAPLEPAASWAFARVLGSDPQMSARYRNALRLLRRLGSGFAGESLDEATKLAAAGKSFAVEEFSLFPPARSYETDLVEKLFGDNSIPANFDLADEMARRIEAGQIQLEPGVDSGWYDYQTFALEPLVIPERMPESAHLKFDDSYKQELIKLFKALLALTRETHVKVVRFAGVGMGMPPREIVLTLSPQITQEPLASFYLRRAQAYRFVQGALLDSFGTEGLAGMHRLTVDGTINMTLDQELRVMEALFYGAYLNTAIELGMSPEKHDHLGFGDAGSLALFRSWNPKVDPDVSRDLRMMVPIFYDKEREMTKVWAVLGVTSKPLRVRYEKLPTLESVVDGRGDPVDLDQVKLTGKVTEFRVVYPVMVEIYVKNVLSRDEMRALCDQYKTQEAILEQLK